MAHQGSSAPLLYTNGTPVGDAPLVWKTLMAHQKIGVPLVIIFFHFYIHTNGASYRSATGSAPVLNFFYSFFCKTTNGAPPHSVSLLV